MRNVDKKYIYLRENKKCFHCGKDLTSLGKATLDHYFPRSKGGSYDLFNLVCSCKKCNKYKRSLIPEDYEGVHIILFKRALEDKKMTYYSTIRVNHYDMVKLAEEIDKVKSYKDYTIFESSYYKFYVKENKIFKVEKKC